MRAGMVVFGRYISPSTSAQFGGMMGISVTEGIWGSMNTVRGSIRKEVLSPW